MRSFVSNIPNAPNNIDFHRIRSTCLPRFSDPQLPVFGKPPVSLNCQIAKCPNRQFGNMDIFPGSPSQYPQNPQS